ncbi:hypothetical protein Metal_2312 [Methylomicrobium album BG8]|uniref:Uncharacterized protein n=1 Tax=Methylomicrobium album BG8 TaxID=686340 RepID=H8GGT6_METAL|nr:hypothetical protein Metal_2312 [Methylomicrobium album BG8]
MNLIVLNQTLPNGSHITRVALEGYVSTRDTQR